MVRTFTISNSAKSLYSFWKQRIHPNPWQWKIDKLSEGKISWECFFEDYTIVNHPALFLSTTKAEQNLLHLAVYQNQLDIVVQLAPKLSTKKNLYGLTALDVAKFLGLSRCIQLLGGSCCLKMGKFANVLIENPDKMDFLSTFNYLTEPTFESVTIFNHLLETTYLAKSKDQIPGEKIWMGIYFNKEVEKALHPSISLRWIDEMLGFGIFAQQQIPSCTFIGEYTGVVKEAENHSLKDNYYCVGYTNWGARNRKLIVDARDAGNFTRFINHSNTPNLGLRSLYWGGIPRMVFVSLREIEVGDQLTFDYGNLFWKDTIQIPLPIH